MYIKPITIILMCIGISCAAPSLDHNHHIGELTNEDCINCHGSGSTMIDVYNCFNCHEHTGNHIVEDCGKCHDTKQRRYRR